MAETVTKKVPKAKLYKMISYKGSSGSSSKQFTPLTAAAAMGEVQEGVKTLLSGINSIGATLNSISLTVATLTEALSKSINTQIKNADKIIKYEDKIAKKEEKRQKDEITRRKKEEAKKKRDQGEEDSEKGKPGLFSKIRKEFKENTKKAFGGLFGALARIAGMFLKFFVIFGILNWMEKNPEKVAKLAKGLASLGKFVYKVASFLVGSAFDGLIKFLENPISLNGLFGAIQFLLSAAPLFVGIAFLKNPLSTVKALTWVLATVGKGIMNMFKAGKLAGKLKTFAKGKFAKAAGVIGAGTLAAGIVASTGGSSAEAIGAGVGAGAGAAIGGAIGGPLGGAAGAAAGGLIGKGIGGMLEPLTEPIGKFFGMIGDVFNTVMAPIKDTFTEFFEAVGGFMNGILDAIEPHLPLITKILGFGVKAMFMPLFLGMKALTEVLKFFTPKKGKSKSSVDGKSAGGPVKTPAKTTILPSFAAGGIAPLVSKEEKFYDAMIDVLSSNQGIIANLKYIGGFIAKLVTNPLGAAKDALSAAWNWGKNLLGFSEGGALQVPMDLGFTPGAPQRAGGGWISGPQSGYPVSLDGGRNVSFIGHGTEWVGYKGYSQGGAFVVPFDTPATRKNRGLTSSRMREASAGGYAMPKFSMGGAIKPTIKGYAEGGKIDFSPSEYNKDTINSDRITHDDKGYILRYTEKNGDVTVKQMNKIVSDNFFKPDDLTGVKPGSAEFKAVTESTGFKSYLKKKHGKFTGSNSRGSGGSFKYDLKSIKIDDNANIAHAYNQSFQANYNYNKSKGYSEEQSKNMAAGAARQFAMPSKDGTLSALPGAKDKEGNLIEGALEDKSLRDITIKDPPKDGEEKSAMDQGMESLTELFNRLGTTMADTGKSLNEGKLKQEETKAKKKMTAQDVKEISRSATLPAIPGGSSGESSMPIVMPGPDQMQADPYLMSKFGLVADFNNDMVDLM